MRLAFVVGAVHLFASMAVAGPILVIDNVKTRDEGGSFEILATFESPADPPCLIGAYSIGLRVENFDGITSPFFFESHNIEPSMIKLGESFGTTPNGELQSGDFIQTVGFSDRNGAVSIEGGTRLMRIDYSTAALADYAFDVSVVENTGNPKLPTLLGDKVPILTSATISFAVPEPPQNVGLSSIAVLFLIRRRSTSSRN